ncbi:hypothetical protein DV515_00003159 [Chloebia gouldiae]|uniref:Uncharacterized protein n=1 Tax=Chloebia gouldiae TaxID=44316 RepID=A0A3L8STU2_CHLGU|nr:hypothetical protein DV515_00003159 [Chloebia gouldiae]
MLKYHPSNARSLTFSGMTISELTTGDSQATDQEESLLPYLTSAMGVSGSSRRGYLIPDILIKKSAAGIGRCFFKQPSKVQVWVACQKSVLKLECKGSRVLMMNTNGFLEDNNGSSKAVAFW